MMRSSVFAVVLCAFAIAACAQCAGTQATSATSAASPTSPTHVQQAHAPAHAVARVQAEAAPARGELIKTAGAQPQDEVRPVANARRARHSDEEHERHSGSAMLLAALALMSGIALRRYSARDE